MLRQKYFYLAWFGLHFLLIITFSCRDTLGLIVQGPTIVPPSFKRFSQKAETAVSAAVGQHLAASNPVRQALATYLHIAGIETEVIATLRQMAQAVIARFRVTLS